MKKAEEKMSAKTANHQSTQSNSINIDYIRNASEVQEVQGLKIDPTFRDVIPKLTEDEFSQLEKNILSDGRVKEPIVVWNHTIIDGHHRFYVVLMHPEIPYKTEERDFESEWAAMAWACANQLGRRNLSDNDHAYLIGKQYEAEKMAHGGTGSNQYTKEQSPHNEDSAKPSGRTAARLAKEHNIGKNTVERHGKYAEGVDIAEEIIPGAKDGLLHGDMNVPQTVVEKIPDVSPEKQKEAVSEITKGNIPEAKNILTGAANKFGLIDDGKAVEFTSKDLLEEFSGDLDKYMSSLRRTVTEHKDLLNDGVIEQIENLFDKAINKFMEEI